MVHIKVVNTNISESAITKIAIEGEYTTTPTLTYYQNVVSNVKLIIAKRPINPKKPPNFLIYLDENDKRVYISSLYQKSEYSFKFDYIGKNYILTKKPNSLRITIRSLYPTWIHQDKKSMPNHE